ncbi:MAG: hypothetical protein ACRD4J_00605 [Nitrososphaeraceae archaeon]
MSFFNTSIRSPEIELNFWKSVVKRLQGGGLASFLSFTKLEHDSFGGRGNSYW